MKSEVGKSVVIQLLLIAYQNILVKLLLIPDGLYILRRLKIYFLNFFI